MVGVHGGPDVHVDASPGVENDLGDYLGDVVARLDAAVVAEGVEDEEPIGGEDVGGAVLHALGEDREQKPLEHRHRRAVPSLECLVELPGQVLLFLRDVHADLLQLVEAGADEEGDEVGPSPEVGIPGLLLVEGVERVRRPLTPARLISKPGGKGAFERQKETRTRCSSPWRPSLSGSSA